MALTISMGIDDDLQLSWGLNFLKSFLQDLIVSLMISFTLNLLLIKSIGRDRKIPPRLRRMTRKCINDNFEKTIRIFKRRQGAMKPNLRAMRVSIYKFPYVLNFS